MSGHSYKNRPKICIKICVRMSMFHELVQAFCFQEESLEKRVNGLNTNLSISGLEIATNTVPFGTKFFPFVTKISG